MGAPLQMKQKERKAWIRIIEAFLAILIITTALLVIISGRSQKQDIGEEIYETQRQILNIISKNDALRQDILDVEYTELNNAIRKMLSPGLDFETKICDLNLICNPDLPPDKEVYSTEIIIASTLSTYDSPKKLRFFVWVN